MFVDGQVLYKIPSDYQRYPPNAEHTADNLQLPFLSVKWGVFALPFPLYKRDFVWCELTCYAKDGSGVCLAISHPLLDQLVPEQAELGLVRGAINMSGYLWKDKPGVDQRDPSQMACDITYLLQVDPKGDLPAWAVNLTGYVVVLCGFDLLFGLGLIWSYCFYGRFCIMVLLFVMVLAIHM